MGKVCLIISKEFRLRNITRNESFQPLVVLTSLMSKKYLLILIKNIKYKVVKWIVTIPFRLWWSLGQKLKFKGVSYVEKVTELQPLKNQIRRIMNDSFTKNRN